MTGFVEGDHAEAGHLRKDPAVEHAAAELQVGHPDLVDELDAVGLGALPAGHEDPGRPERSPELALGLGVGGQHLDHLGADAFPFGGHGGLMTGRVGSVGRKPHPVDGRQGQVRFGFPGRAPGLPLVGAAATVGVEELVENSHEVPGIVTVEFP